MRVRAYTSAIAAVIVAAGLLGGSAPATAEPAVAGSVAPAATLKALTAPTPTISGVVQTRQRLTAKAGSWTAGTTLRYQWSVGGAAVPNMTSSTYVVRPLDVGKTITVTVTGTKAGYATKSVTSAPTGKAVGIRYANCTALRADYPDGVRKTTVTGDRKSGVLKPFVGRPFSSNALFALQPKSLDRDVDGIMCER